MRDDWLKWPPALRMSRHLGVTLALTLAAGLILGVLVGFWVEGNRTFVQSFQPELRKETSTFVSPLLDCEQLPSNRVIGYPKIKSNVQSIVNQALQDHRVSAVSVYWRNLNNGEWFVINPEEKYVPASLMKMTILIAYQKILDQQPDLAEKELIFDPEDIIYKKTYSNNVNIKTLQPGRSYSTQELMKLVVEESDNFANALLKQFVQTTSPGLYQAVNFDFGIDSKITDNLTEFYTIIDSAKIFRVLYNATYLSSERSNQLLEAMTKAHFDDGLRGSIPKSIPIAHKFGFRDMDSEFQLHDCGIVYAPNKPYLICVMTKGDSYVALSGTIVEISNSVYHQISQE